jgi:hypothetical protein
MPVLFKALLVVAVSVGAFVLFGVALLIKARWFPRRCPRCRWRTLKDVGGMIRATKIDAEGRHYPAAWTDFKCGQCHGLFREHVGGRWEDVPPVER